MYPLTDCGDFGLVDEVLRQKISGNRAFVLFLEVAFVFVRLLVSLFSKDVVVIFVQGSVFYVIHTAVAHFKGVTIESLIMTTGFREMFVNEIEEVSSNIQVFTFLLYGWLYHADDISSSVSFLARRNAVVVVAVRCFRWLCRRCSSNCCLR